MRVTSPRSWLMFLALAAVILAALLWGFVGRVPRTVSGQAILAQPGGITNVVATAPGMVTEVMVAPGDLIAPGQVIARLQALADLDDVPAAGAVASPVADRSIAVVSPQRGRVVELLVDPGNVVDIGDPVASFEGDDDTVIAFMYVSDAVGKQIDPGMKVQVSPATVDASQYGYLVGRVESVSEYPVTERGLTRLLDNDQLVRQLLSDGPVLQVVIELEENPATESGYTWSSPKGPPYELSHGTFAEAAIVLDEQRPIELVLPGL
jgi:multidrug resistance efflux pump